MSWTAAWNVQGVGTVPVRVPEPPVPPPPRRDTPIRINRYLALPHALFQEAVDTIALVGVDLTHDQAVAFLAKDHRGAHILYFDEVETQLRESLCDDFVRELFAPQRAPSWDDPNRDRKVAAEALVKGYALTECAVKSLRKSG